MIPAEVGNWITKKTGSGQLGVTLEPDVNAETGSRGGQLIYFNREGRLSRYLDGVARAGIPER